MKCDLVKENDYSEPSKNGKDFNITSDTTNISNNKSSYDTQALRNGILEDDETRNSIHIKSDKKNPVRLSSSKESRRIGSNEIYVNSNSSYKPYLPRLGPKGTHPGLMMAALGQPSAAPPSCGASQPSADPR